jgi:hypothetical protein
MPFFNKSPKIAPDEPQTKKNNFFAEAPAGKPESTDSFYLCMPGKAEFFIDKLLLKLSNNINGEQQLLEKNKLQINNIAIKINHKHQELLNNHGDMRAQQSRQMQLEDLMKKLKNLEIDRVYLKEHGANFIPNEDWFGTPADAIQAQLKNNSKHDLVLIKINIPLDKFNSSVVRGQEVTRPDLLTAIEHITEISKTQTAKILGEQHKATAKGAKPNGAVLRLVAEILDANTEYKRSSFSQSATTPTLVTSPGAAVIKLNERHAIIFEPIKKGAKEFDQDDSKSNTPRSSKR